jgi:hypothetical protein
MDGGEDNLSLLKTHFALSLAAEYAELFPFFCGGVVRISGTLAHRGRGK